MYGPSDKEILVAEFITPSLQWDVPKLNQYLVREDVEVIRRLLISSSAPDRWIWHYDKRGEYSMKSGYKLSMMNRQEASNSSQGQEARWWKKIWKMRVPKKVKHFVWKSFNNSIPTMVNLWNHHVSVNGSCLVCQEEIETSDHALFRCFKAREVWDLLFPGMVGDLWSHMDIKDRWLSFEGRMANKFELICVGAWAIWNARNNLVHNRPILILRPVVNGLRNIWQSFGWQISWKNLMINPWMMFVALLYTAKS